MKTTDNLKKFVTDTCRSFKNDRGRMMDIARAVQERFGHVPSEALDIIAGCVGTQRVDVESLVTFYSFLSLAPKGKTVVRICGDVVDRMFGAGKVAEAFTRELGIGMGETTADGKVTLEWTACIGMSDQAPAALINDVVFTNLSGERAAGIARALKDGASPESLVKKVGDGNNADPLVHAMVWNNIRLKGQVIFAPFENGSALRKALAMTPAEVIREVKTSRLRGRGGAGFPTGMKWEYTRQASGNRKFVLCNADEGEPGTFKDRAVLTECPDLMIEGMTIAAYAVGAEECIVYLRAEYAYLRAFLENVLQKRRDAGLLGRNICGKKGVNCDVRIQMGAGAYICGEETSLISSCEGSRGDPKTRPPYPVQEGYLGCPTSVNNVETLCCVSRILDKGPGWFAETGPKGSAGTKLLSVSGDCSQPGVYEVPFGITVRSLLTMVGAESPVAVQVGGPSGRMIGPQQFDKTISFDDLSTGGSLIVFGPGRNVVDVARQFMEFFVEESCGYCTPCRAGNVFIKEKIDRILAGRGEPADLDYLVEIGKTMKLTSRCGLGQSSANPVLTSIENFRAEYEKLMSAEKGSVFIPAFDIREALKETEELVGRSSERYRKGVE